VGTMYDFTERKAERLRLEEQLAQAQKMEAVGKLAGGISHDFNNLLTVILSYSEIVATALPVESGLTSEVGEIRRAAQRAVRLTRQLLAYSRQQILRPTDLDLNNVVSDMAAMLRRVIAEDIVLELRPGAQSATVRTDPGQLEQVIVNLAVNARDAMPGGGKLTLSTSFITLDAQTEAAWMVPVRPGPYVLLEVTDSGEGMDAETQRRIFEPFFTTKSKGRGTGLGLATVYGIVKQSGGYIWVDSRPGAGTTFRIYLPQVTTAMRALTPVVQLPVLARGTETVLVVEDEYAVRALTRRILWEAGYTVLDACSGEEAIAALEAQQGLVDLICTDVVMPGMNGREIAWQALARWPSTKILYISGYDDGVLTERARGLGGALAPDIAFLHKPFTPESLTRRVRDVLDNVPRLAGDGPALAMVPDAPE